MLLSAALLALFVTGFWLYCLTDAILTPAPECKGLTKPAWIAVIAVTFIGGALAWLIVRRPARDSPPPPTTQRRWDAVSSDDEDYLQSLHWTDEDDAVARHPAGRARLADPEAAPKGPDDDLDFLRVLDRAIHGNRQGGGEA
jgi:Phospholipase_D-nuclease N-terminal